MTAIQVHHTATNEDRAWDGPAEVAKLDTPITKSMAQGMFAWYDPSGTDDNGDGWPDVKDAYKFGHHFVTDGKPGEASIKGCNNGLARLSQADIPADERAGVEKHLRAHRRDAGLEDEAGESKRSGQAIRIVQGEAKPFEPFWRTRAASEGQPAEIDFFGYISEFSWLGDEISPQRFKEDLARVGQGGPVTIRLHSGGGDLFAAAAIRAILVDYPGAITVKIMGLAASAAVAIALAGDEIQIFDTAYMMIHNPGWPGLMGWLDESTLRKFADMLDLFAEGMINAYEARTGMGREEIAQMMDAETWMTAQQAVDLGFADKVITADRAPAQLSASALQAFAHVPAALIQSEVSGQAPGMEPAPAAAQAHREKLEAGKQKYGKEVNMTPYLRTMLSQREALLAKAQEIVATAEAESRELSDEERAAFEVIMGKGEEAGELGALDAHIDQALADRESVRKAAERKFALPGTEAVKPEEGEKRPLTRAEFDKLSPGEQREFLRGGGKLVD